MIKLNWKEIRDENFLSDDLKTSIVDELNSLASRHPEGFDIEFPVEYEKPVLHYLRTEIDEIIIEEVGKDIDTFCLAIYQNETDRYARESKR